MNKPLQKDSAKIEKEEVNYIANANAAVLEQVPQGGKLLIWGLVTFIAIAIAWSYFAELDIVVRGHFFVWENAYNKLIIMRILLFPMTWHTLCSIPL